MFELRLIDERMEQRVGFGASGLAVFITVTDAEIAEAVRVILSTTHNLVEGAGAMGVAAAMKMKEQLVGKKVGVVFCGGNMDTAVLKRILGHEL